ncbi:MAG TPA: response regulator transcription factor [Rhizomicrobium sp.]|jgi:DNA-binding response OmpR family regulator
MSKHILVVEDDDGVRSALQRWLTSDGFRVTAVGDGRRVAELLSSEDIDLVIVDICLPDTDGLRLTTQMREDHDVGIIILSGRSDLMDRVVGLEMGADDYLTKPFEPREVLARVRSVLRRMRAPAVKLAEPTTPAAYRFDGWMVDITSHTLFDPTGVPTALTSGEYQLLEAFVTHANRVLSRDQLIEWTNVHDSPAFDRSIDTRIGRLRRKLNDQPREPRYIKTVRNGGYLFAAKVTAA